MTIFVAFIALTVILLVSAAVEHDIAKVSEALAKTRQVMGEIYTEWDVDNFPAFLASAAMPTKSYEVMKLKYERVVLEALIHPAAQMNFTISFMGSSVTAGHDSPFNLSFTEITGRLMAPAFAPVHVNLITRNAAMGNNPCIPYDACPSAFAGKDADVIHWEQSYNCFATDEGPRTHVVFETFVRQIAQMHRRPVVVFADSATPNWRAKDCKPSDILPTGTYPVVNVQDKAMLNSTNHDPTYLDLFSNVNGGMMRSWGTLKQIMKMYRTAGIQLFRHTEYLRYKCNGPYIEDWGCCSASWHPSLKGHALRAAHHSFVWLKIFETALVNVESMLKADGATLVSVVEEVVKRQGNPSHHIPEQPLYESKYGDELQCLTDYEPHHEETASLTNRLIPSDGVAGSALKGWKQNIMESVFEPHAKIVETARKKGYRDFKWMTYGNNADGPLSIDITAGHGGYIHFCQPPGSWGKLPAEFTSLWTEGSVDIFITLNVPAENKKEFKFDSSKATRIAIQNPYAKDTQSVCAISDEMIQAGSHVITLVPLKKEFAMLSIILVP